MKISTTLRYALRFVMLLAERRELISTVEAARKLGISPLYLRQIASRLEKSQIVKSRRGAAGGYELSKSPSSITVLDIAMSVEERIHFIDCLMDKKNCPKSFECKARLFWLKLNETVINEMQKATVAEILNYDPDKYYELTGLPGKLPGR